MADSAFEMALATMVMVTRRLRRVTLISLVAIAVERYTKTVVYRRQIRARGMPYERQTASGERIRSPRLSTPSTFNDLIRRVRAGDEDAATELVKRYEPAIRRAVRFRMADTRLERMMDSMDICQSVFASFFERTAAGQFDLEQPEQLMKLLMTMARNKLANQAQGLQRQCRDYRRVSNAELDERQVAADQSSPSMHVAGKELIFHADRLLSEDERQLRDLRKEGLDWGTIARQLGSTPEALRKKLARAMERVSQELHLDTDRHE
jgi:RNA polymerase sigma factor (sigma-70 family)